MSERNQKAGLAIAVGILFLLGLAAKPSEDKPDSFKPPDTGPDPEPDPEPNPDAPEKNDPPFDEIVTPDGEWPEPGQFYQVQKDDFLLQIASRTLFQAAYKAAREIGGLDQQSAINFANEFRRNGNRQANFVNDIQCESWNDAVYSTYGFDNLAEKSPSGRAMRLLPQHANNFQRLRTGQKPRRRQGFGKKQDREEGKTRSGSGSKYELLYIPGINLDVLWNVGQVQLGGEWPDGASKANPPEWVLDLGVKDLTGTIPKGNILRGCVGRPRVKVNVS